MFFSVRKGIGSVAGSFCGVAGALALKKSLTVFVYHDVTDDPSEFSSSFGLNVPPKVFEYQIRFIKGNFNVIGPDELLGQGFPDRAALITFDDGFRSFYTNALPLVQSHGLPVTVFLNMEAVRGKVLLSGLTTYLCMKDKGFVDYLKNKTALVQGSKPPYLYCSRQIVESYIRGAKRRIEAEARSFVGEIITGREIELASQGVGVYYGNHLFNHDVPILMRDDELAGSYERNARDLRRYHNYRDIFAFPFGQPDTCFNDAQVGLLLRCGAKRVFASSGRINRDRASAYLDRVSPGAMDDSAGRLWFRIFKQEIRKGAAWAS